MKNTHFKPLNTININSHIFEQDQPNIKSTLPINLLKSLVEKTRFQRNSKSLVERYQPTHHKRRNLSITKQEYQTNETKQQWTHDAESKLEEITLLRTKKYQKISTECHRRNSISDKQFNPQQKHKQTQPSQPVRTVTTKIFQNPLQSLTTKHRQKNEQSSKNIQKTRYATFFKEENKVNPYTQQQYTYLKNKEKDHLTELRKTIRFKRIGSIVESYKITPIELAPPRHRRRPSVEPPKPKIFNPYSPNKPGKEKQTKKTSYHTLDFDVIPPSPWDWGHQHRQYFHKDFMY